LDKAKSYETDVRTPKFLSELCKLAMSDPFNYRITNKLSIFREVLKYQIERNDRYRKFMEKQGWDPNDLRTESDIEEIPYVRASIFKRYKDKNKKEISDIPEKLLCVPKDTVKPYQSSATSGNPSIVYMNELEYYIIGELYNWDMHGVKDAITFSLSPPPEFMKNLFFKAVTDGLERIAKEFYYALQIDPQKGIYLDIEKIKEILNRAQKDGLKVAGGPSPFLTYNLTNKFIEMGLKWELKDIYIHLGGGGYVDKKGRMVITTPLTPLKIVNNIRKVFPNIEVSPRLDSNITDTYSSSENPSTTKGHLSNNGDYFCFHVPTYARVVIRNPETGEPVEEGEIGNPQLISTLSWSQAGRNSVLQDGDLVQLLSKDKCDECGYRGTVFRFVSRTKTPEGMRKKQLGGYDWILS